MMGDFSNFYLCRLYFKSSNHSGEENIIKLKEENLLLKKQLKARECEVKHLENVIRNMKGL